MSKVRDCDFLTYLEPIAKAPSIGEIARRSGLCRSAVHQRLQTMLKKGWIEKIGNKYYRYSITSYPAEKIGANKPKPQLTLGEDTRRICGYLGCSGRVIKHESENYWDESCERCEWGSGGSK